MRVAIYSLGCKVNIYESEYLINLLQQNNYILDDFNNEVDIYIINTCTVTNEADKKARKLIHSTRKKHPNSILIVMGCYSQLNYQEIDADIIIGNKYKSKIPALIEKYLKTKEKIILVEDISKTTFEDMYINRFNDHTRAFVKIQDGCNAFCSYCTIPYARGGLRSKDFDTVINEVTNLVNNGYKEIVLTGIHTGHYGSDLDTTFPSLLKKIVKIEGLLRLRISSIEITELNDEFKEVLKNNKVIVSHLHIPLQSGSDEILKSMNRKYLSDYYLKEIETIRNIRPDISITTDIIVGFPSETEKLFQETLEFVNTIKFSKIHVFPYSRRSGTKADLMEEQVPEIIKKDRVKRLIELSNKLEREYLDLFISKDVLVLTETTDNNTTIGHTDNYLKVLIDSKIDSNQLVKVHITERCDLILKGYVIENGKN